MNTLIIGCGNMGSAFVGSFLQKRELELSEIAIVDMDPEKHEGLRRFSSKPISTDILEHLDWAELIILGVKPQQAEKVYPLMKGKLTTDQILLSIMAGETISNMMEQTGHNKVVRAMPNTPCLVGKGVVGFSASPDVGKEEIVALEKLLSANGTAIYFDNEEMMDAVTAVSGSGPAYFFQFLQHMVESGVKLGLKKKTADLMARQTMLGAYHLYIDSGESLENLIKKVTSKGGTTEAALNTYKEEGLGDTVHKALSAAFERSKELGEND